VSVLRDARLVIAPAEVHALIGQNGAGKSTLIKILNGAYTKDAGSVLIEGAPVDFQSPHDAQLGGVSTIFQEVNLVHYRSVTENIVLGQEPRKWGMIDWARAHNRARDVVARFGLDIDVRRPLHHYNIAIQQLIAIARAVSFSARLVIMDEPTSSLDEQEKEVLFEVIRGLRADGVSVLYVSHHLDELFAVCDRVTIMRDGRMVGEHAIKEVTKLDLVAAMIGRDRSEIQKQGATGFSAGVVAGDEVVLEVKDLSNGRNLKSVSFLVHKGEIVGLAGLLGSGRSETAELVFGAEAPARGETLVKGAKTAFSAPVDAIASGMGFCTEDRKADGIFPDLSVRENLTLAMLPKMARRGMIPREEERKLVERFIKSLGIKTSGQEQPIRELSGGNQQKVLLSRWLSLDPDLLILDEPTRGIDVGAKHEIQKLIDALARQGMAILMISSEFEELAEGSNRVIVLHEGNSVAVIERDELSEDTIINAVAAHSQEAQGPR